MTANSRLAKFLVAAALAVAPTLAIAQAAPTTNSTSPDTVGPSELQNFNLKGTVTRQADQPAVTTPARPRARPVTQPTLTTTPPPPRVRTVERAAPPVPTQTQPPSPATQSPAQSIAPPPAPVVQAPTVAPVTAPPAAQVASPPPPSADPFAIFRGMPLWPWIAAALALALGSGFLLWRRRTPRYAGAGAQFDLLVPVPEVQSEPEPRPLPRAPEPQAPSPPAPGGLVTTRLRPATPTGVVASRLRPALELGFHPLRCQVDDDQVAIEFELELFNAGTAPARAVLAEASLLNAGSTQEQDLAAFFGNPNGVGERLAVIQPMKRVSFKSQVVAPRDAVQEYELAGRKAFVPVIAFNALYEWSGGQAQSSAAYLVGRDTQQDKLGPLRLDQGAREYSGLGARPLPTAVRT